MNHIRRISIESRQRIAVGVGAAIGTLLRAGLGTLAGTVGHAVLWSTLFANVAGSLLLGVLLGWRLRHSAPSTFTIPFIGIGLLGSFTTFSTFAYETLALTQQADFLRASVNVLMQVILCLACVWLGFAVSRML